MALFTRRSLLAACAFSAAACSSGNGSGGAGGGGGASALRAEVARAAAAGPAVAVSTAADLAEKAVDALSGGGTLRTFGTLRAAPQPSYDPTPADRLVVVLPDGAQAELFVTRMTGDVAAGGVEFLRGAHDLDVRVVLPGTGDLAIAQRAANGVTGGKIAGALVLDGVEHEVDLAHAGTVLYDRGFGSLQYESEQRVQGTLRGPELSADVDEELRFVLVGDGREVVNQSTRRFSGTWFVGAARYELRDGLLDRSFRDGLPNELDTVWQARGTLLRDGAVVGEISGRLTPLEIGAVLRLAGGPEVVLESFRL